MCLNKTKWGSPYFSSKYGDPHPKKKLILFLTCSHQCYWIVIGYIKYWEIEFGIWLDSGSQNNPHSLHWRWHIICSAQSKIRYCQEGLPIYVACFLNRLWIVVEKLENAWSELVEIKVPLATRSPENQVSVSSSRVQHFWYKFIFKAYAEETAFAAAGTSRELALHDTALLEQASVYSECFPECMRALHFTPRWMHFFGWLNIV
jgi:hypothetical protein